MLACIQTSYTVVLGETYMFCLELFVLLYSDEQKKFELDNMNENTQITRIFFHAGQITAWCYYNTKVGKCDSNYSNSAPFRYVYEL